MATVGSFALSRPKYTRHWDISTKMIADRRSVVSTGVAAKLDLYFLSRKLQGKVNMVQPDSNPDPVFLKYYTIRVFNPRPPPFSCSIEAHQRRGTGGHALHCRRTWLGTSSRPALRSPQRGGYAPRWESPQSGESPTRTVE